MKQQLGRITDHALVRYIERVHGIDLDSVRQEILDNGVGIALENKVSKLTIDGAKYVFKDCNLITVIAKGECE